MSLPTSITAVDSNTVDVIFDEHRESGLSKEYVAPSPQGDLAGRPVAKVTQNPPTKNKVVSTKLVVDVPEYDATDETYDGFAGVDIVLRRKTTADTTAFLNTVTIAQSILDQIKVKLIAGEL